MNYPNWVYIAMNLSRDTEENIKKYCSEHLPDIEMTDDLHSTVIYSKKPHEKKIKRDQCRCKWNPGKFAKYWDDKESLVIEIDSEDMQSMNNKMMEEHDFVTDYPEYKPHITLTYAWKEIDIDSLPPMEFPIEMEHQVIENLDEEAMTDEKKDDDLMTDEEMKNKKDEDEDEDEVEKMSEWFVM